MSLERGVTKRGQRGWEGMRGGCGLVVFFFLIWGQLAQVYSLWKYMEHALNTFNNFLYVYGSSIYNDGTACPLGSLSSPWPPPPTPWGGPYHSEFHWS